MDALMLFVLLGETRVRFTVVGPRHNATAGRGGSTLIR